jgi:murein DD-endopeptidase MepM/ murein hydrolase activator NlpD
MHVIVFAHRLATPRSVTITARHLAIAAAFGMAAMVAGAALLYYFSFRYAADLKLPVLQQMVAAARADDVRKSDEYLRQNLNAMAVKLGEMQAQLIRLDALGQRVSGMAGLKPTEFRLDETPGRGGAEPTQARNLSMAEFARELDQVSHGVDSRSDFFSVMETELFNAKLTAKRLPTVLPVNATYNSSGFGRRLDPFTGQSAMHEGIDFIAQPGTPIVAAAGGVVIAAQWHHDFGNMIEIDHGNDIVTRYAHTQVMFVKAGDIVKRGQKIAEVGSTGRATGPHLHFEVRFQGVAQNPVRFLQSAEDLPAPPNMVAQNVGHHPVEVKAAAGDKAAVIALPMKAPGTAAPLAHSDARVIP